MTVDTRVEPTPHAARYLRCVELAVLVFGDHRGADAVEGALAAGAVRPADRAQATTNE